MQAAPRTGELPASRSAIVAASARLAPAESPAIAMRVGIDAPDRALRRRPADRGDAIVQRHREGMLGRQRIIDADDAHAGTLRKLPRNAVIDIDVADHEAAAMQKHDRRRGRGRARIVKPDADFAARGRYPPLLDMRNRRRAGRDIEWQQTIDQVARARGCARERSAPRSQRPYRCAPARPRPAGRASTTARGKSPISRS